MASRTGEVTSIVGCLLFLSTLILPYLLKPPDAVTNYYTYGFFNAFIGAILVFLVLATVIATRENRISRQFGTGVGLGLAMAALVFTAAWAATARVDVFLARGWLLPMQRFILVGFTGLIVIGIGWQMFKHDAGAA